MLDEEYESLMVSYRGAKKDLAIAVEALRFYADGYQDWHLDRGNNAREALEKIKVVKDE